MNSLPQLSPAFGGTEKIRGALIEVKTVAHYLNVERLPKKRCSRLPSQRTRTKIGALQIRVSRIERHQLQHHAVGPAKAVMSRILAAPARLVGCDHVRPSPRY